MLAFFNSLSPYHILLVLIVALIFYGNRLPEVARSLGRSINEFKRGMRDINDEFDRDPPEKLTPPREPENTIPRTRENEKTSDPERVD